MNHSFSYRLLWDKGESQSHDIELDLDMELTDILQFPNIEDKLLLEQSEIRRKIFEMVISELIPAIVNEIGLDGTIDTFESESDIQIDHTATTSNPKREGLDLQIRSKFHMAMDITVNRPVNAMQALVSVNGNIATLISNEIVKHLKLAILIVDETKTSTSFSLDGDHLESLEHGIDESSADNN